MKKKSDFINETLLVFITQMLNVVFMFGINILGNRIFSPGIYGEFIYYFTIINLVVVIAKFGMDQGIMAYLPKLYSDESAKKSLISFTYLFTTFLSVIVVLFMSSIFRMFFSESIKSIFVSLILLLPLFTFVEVSGGIFRINNLVKIYVFTKNITINTVQLLFMIICIILGFKSPISLFFLVTFSYLVSFIIMIYVIIKNKLFGKIKNKYFFLYKDFLLLSYPLLFSGIFSIAMTKMDIIFIGTFLNTTSVALYSAVMKIANLTLFVISVVNMTLLPKLSQLFHESKNKEFTSLYKLTTKLIYLLSMIFITGIIIFGKDILLLFGKQFASGYVPLLIVCIGNIASAAIGATGYLNIVFGYPKYEMLSTMTAFIFNVILNIVLIPKLGINGAAIAFLISSLVQNGMRLYFSRVKYNMHPFDLDYIYILCLSVFFVFINNIVKSGGNFVFSLSLYVIFSALSILFIVARNIVIKKEILKIISWREK